MGIQMTDVTGTPRPDSQLREALEEVKRWFVVDATSKDKKLMVRIMQYTVIMDGLKELLTIRELLRKRREEGK